MNNCGCCQGIEQLTPQATANRPGLRALRYRAGTHATFLEAMLARLSSLYLDLPREEIDDQGRHALDRIYPLRNLRTRATDDPAIALLDAWAVLGDVLTFYQERIANEGYLMTAIERRSILELARLIGYELRPGVSASVFLAYTIDDKTTDLVIIPVGAKSQSVPGPGELPQTFETREPLEARASWNYLRPRRTRPQTEATITTAGAMRVYLKGITTNLKAGDPLLIDFGDHRDFYRVTDVAADAQVDRTLVKFDNWTSTKVVPGGFRASLENTIANLRDTASLSPSTAKSKFVARLQDFADDLQKKIEVAADQTEIAALHNQALTDLENELGTAAANANFKNVHAWLAPVVETMRAEGASARLNEMTALAVNDGGLKTEHLDPIAAVMSRLVQSASVPPRSTNFLNRTPAAIFGANSDIGPQIVTSLQPALRGSFAAALSGGKATRDASIHVYALRATASPFGHNAPLKIISIDANTHVPKTEEWNVNDMRGAGEHPDTIFLDASYDKVLPGSWIVIDTSAVNKKLLGHIKLTSSLVIAQVSNPNAHLSRPAYSITGKTTSIELVDTSGNPTKWFDYIGEQGPSAAAPPSNDFQIIRRSAVFAQSEELTLAEEPIEIDVCRGRENWAELDGWYADLKSGRWAIVSGERADVKVPDANDPQNEVSVPGLKASELVMLAEVIQDVSTADGEPSSNITEGKSKLGLPAEKPHTFIRFAKPLSYCYRRDSVKIYGNVVKATHGETRKEVLGSGDASKSLQSFTLKQPPLTFVAAPNPQGVDSTLKLYVNDVQWHETSSLARLLPAGRKFIARSNDEGQTTITFGNGEHGARPPTGRENIRAEYRNGIGRAGNVNVEQISLLMTRPLGVTEVINPLRASGGADKESRDQARDNAPLALTALDRLVSTQDYADFARTFAGIGKTAATRLADGKRELVHLTIAGADDIPIEPTSDLYRNLVLALRQFGDPFQPFRVEVRELMLIVISANVRIDSDYQWDNVAPKIRSTLLDTFSFQHRGLGQDVVLSEVISALQNVPGVVYVDVDRLRGIPEKKTASNGTRQLLTPDEILVAAQKPKLDANGNPRAEPFERVSVELAGNEDGSLRPAQIAILSPDVPDTLMLNQIV